MWLARWRLSQSDSAARDGDMSKSLRFLREIVAIIVVLQLYGNLDGDSPKNGNSEMQDEAPLSRASRLCYNRA
jgi:hypothetical protein